MLFNIFNLALKLIETFYGHFTICHAVTQSRFWCLSSDEYKSFLRSKILIAQTKLSRFQNYIIFLVCNCNIIKFGSLAHDQKTIFLPTDWIFQIVHFDLEFKVYTKPIFFYFWFKDDYFLKRKKKCLEHVYNNNKRLPAFFTVPKWSCWHRNLVQGTGEEWVQRPCQSVFTFFYPYHFT